MASQLEKYRMRDNQTRLNAAYFNRVWEDLDIRLVKLEGLQATWDAATRDLRDNGLVRLDQTISPLIQQARADLDALAVDLQQTQDDFAAQAQANLDNLQTQTDAGLADLDARITAAEAQLDTLISDTQAHLDSIAYLGWISPHGGAAYTYDAEGRIDTITETLPGGDRVTQYSYDAQGLITQHAVTYLGVTRTVAYSYTDGRITGETVTEA